MSMYMYMYNDSHVNYTCINEIVSTCIPVLLHRCRNNFVFGGDTYVCSCDWYSEEDLY